MSRPGVSPLLAAVAAAPTVTAEALLAGRRSLVVVAPHPDDETLGCGALLHEAAAGGIATRVVCMTDGSASHPNSRIWDRPRLAAMRRRELSAALSALAPGGDVIWLNYPDCGLPQARPGAEGCVARLAATFPADALVAAAWGGDPHVDHERTAALVARALGGRPDLAVVWYPIWGRFSTDRPFRGLRALAAGPAAAEAKRRALACHASQMTRLVHDDPAGFVMSREDQAHFLQHPEIFLAA